MPTFSAIRLMLTVAGSSDWSRSSRAAAQIFCEVVALIGIQCILKEPLSIRRIHGWRAGNGAHFEADGHRRIDLLPGTVHRCRDAGGLRPYHPTAGPQIGNRSV